MYVYYSNRSLDVLNLKCRCRGVKTVLYRVASNKKKEAYIQKVRCPIRLTFSITASHLSTDQREKFELLYIMGGKKEFFKNEKKPSACMLKPNLNLAHQFFLFSLPADLKT